jgi:hypothetical protein
MELVTEGGSWVHIVPVFFDFALNYNIGLILYLPSVFIFGLVTRQAAFL